MRSTLLAAALLLAPLSGLAVAQDSVRVPGHWETHRDFAETPGHLETRARSVWRPEGYVTETRTRALPGRWEIDFAGNRIWIGGSTVTETVQVHRPGRWETVRENVWIAGARSERARQVWVPEHFERTATATPVNPWDDTPRAQAIDGPRVSVESINGVGALAPTSERTFSAPLPSRERLNEPFLPTAPRLEAAPDPFSRPQQPVAPAPRPCKPLVLVGVEPETPAPTVVYREPAPASVVYVGDPCPPPVVYVGDPCPPRVVYVGDPCPPRVVVFGHERHWRPAPCAPPCGPRVGFGVGVRFGGGVRVGVGVGFGGVGVGIGFGGHHHR